MKNIVILGAGESGLGAALLAKAKGFEVFVSDKGAISEEVKEALRHESIPFEEQMHTEAIVLAADEIIKSPGIPDTVALVQEARKKGIPVISEIEFAARYTNAKLITITGSNGKTTTTLLVYHFLKSAGYKVGLAGNIGDSFARQVIEDVYDYFVLEISSFQLDGMYEFKSDVAVLLNITPDHLDRYAYKFENYIESKFRIVQNMTPNDYFITYVDDEVIQQHLQGRTSAFQLSVSLENRLLNGAYVSGNSLMINIHNHITKVFSLDSDALPLSGKHNQINIMMATLAALAAGVDQEVIIQSIGRFKNAPHRLEEVAIIRGVRYVNDSKATNVDSVRYALDSVDRPVVWLAGGVDKGNDYKLIEELVYEKVRALICIGKDNSKLKEAFGDKLPHVIEIQDMGQAIRMANEIAAYNDVVLLSPACASFDCYKNYEDRGNKFKRAVKDLEDSQPGFDLKTLER